MNKKIIVALFGAAGVGKDTLQKEIVKQSPDLFHEIISTTTRPLREYEKNGKDYIFLSDDEYEKHLKENAFLEHADFRGWHYGTLATSIKPNCFNIGVFNISGVKQLLKLPSDQYYIIPVFIVASQKTRLLRQLNREDYPDCDEIIRRYQADAIDLAPDNLNFWYLVESNDFKEDVSVRRAITHAAEVIIRDIYEYELNYFLRGT